MRRLRISYHTSGPLPNCGSSSRAWPSLSRSTRKQNSELYPLSMGCSFHSPVPRPGFSHHASLLAEPGARHNVGAPVAVHVDGQVRKIVDVVVGSRIDELNFAELVRRPLRRLVPILAGDNVQALVAVHVGDGGGLAGAAVEHPFLERDFGGAAGGPGYKRGERAEGDQCNVPFHWHNSTAVGRMGWGNRSGGRAWREAR